MGILLEGKNPFMKLLKLSEALKQRFAGSQRERKLLLLLTIVFHQAESSQRTRIPQKNY